MAETTPPPSLEDWEFPGWGTARRLKDLDTKGVRVKRLDQPKHLLGPWRSTAICGNDITSSCLYVSALCAAQAGAYAPIALGLVAAVLYLFRKIYAEVGSALPLNGGTYTVLLNTTNKKLAAAAACLTLLSYVATAVISASEAMHYAHNLWSGLHVFGATIVLLGLFALLNVIGITESAAVALGIFVLHMLTLTVLSLTSGVAVLRDPSLLAANWSAPTHAGPGAGALLRLCRGHARHQRLRELGQLHRGAEAGRLPDDPAQHVDRGGGLQPADQPPLAGPAPPRADPGGAAGPPRPDGRDGPSGPPSAPGSASTRSWCCRAPCSPRTWASPVWCAA